MTSITTQVFPSYIVSYSVPLEVNIRGIDRGEKVKTSVIQYQQEDVESIEKLAMKLLSKNNNFLSSQPEVTITSKTNKDIYMSDRQANDDSELEINVRKVKELIAGQIENPLIDMAVNQQIDELAKTNRLRFFPMNPSRVAINFDFDSNNNLVMHQRLEYDKYAEYITTGAEIEQNRIYEFDKPFVTVDCLVKFSPNGDALTSEDKLHIDFNGCGNDLNEVFDKRSLWDKICDYLGGVFNFHKNIIDMKYTTPIFYEDKPSVINNDVDCALRYNVKGRAFETENNNIREEYTTNDSEYMELCNMNKNKIKSIIERNSDRMNPVKK